MSNLMLGSTRVVLYGSVHSCEVATRAIVGGMKELKPSHVCLELCMRRFISLSSGGKGATDMAAVLEYCNSEKIKMHCIDQSIYSTATAFRERCSPAAFRDILIYVMVHKPLERFSFAALQVNLLAASRGYRINILHRLISRWLLPPELLSKAIKSSLVSGDVESGIGIINSIPPTNSPNPFHQSSPRGYQKLCQVYGLDRILFETVIQERNSFMANSIRKVVEEVGGPGVSIAVVVGENHIPGLLSLLATPQPIEDFDSIIPTLRDWFNLKILSGLLNS